MAEYLINAIEISSLQVAFEIFINEGRLMRVIDAADGNWTQKGNPFLVQGENEIALAVRPLQGHGAIDPRAKVDLKIFEGPYGDHPGDAGKVHEFAWSQGATPITTTDFRVIHQKQFPTRAAQTRWSWEDATPYTPADRNAIIAVVGAVHATLVAKDYDAFAAYNVVRDADLATALDVPMHTLVSSDRMLLDSLMQQDDWVVEPFDPAAFEMHPTANGRLVEVTGPSKTGPIVAGAAGEQIDFPLTFSNLPDVGWAITR